MKESETYIRKDGQFIGKNDTRRSDTFITKSKKTGREVRLNDMFADTILNKNGYEFVPKTMVKMSGIDFDKDGNIIR